MTVLLDLLPQHRQLLKASAISEEVARARGYRSIGRAEARELGFTGAQTRPGLLIPLWRVDGEPGGYYLRPDDPRMTRDGKAIKYEAPKGQPNILDVNPLIREALRKGSQAILITDDGAFGDAVAAAVERHLAGLERAAIAGASWRANGAIIRVARLDDAAALIDRLAPEHLELAVADPDALADRVRHAGAIFLGRHTPEAIGDYVAGPNHVLPTARSARFSSGLSVLDFLKRTSLVRCSAEALAKIGPAAVTLATAEGLGAHALSVQIRLDRGRAR
ncbi:MAG: histidinol dehydrogenase [Proteobacteria bacterium]|nr:histidinol dehydrogenase [Pseudomonadota bacterium]